MGWDSNDILHRPIELSDISVATGIGKVDIGGGVMAYDLGTMLSSVNIVNIWAAMKAVRSSETGELTAAQRLAANYGLSIPRYAASAFITHYADQWTYERPRGVSYNEIFRVLDFEEYVRYCYWMLGPSGNNGLYTIFNGYLGVPASTVYAGDTIIFEIQCIDDPDAGIPGLLYPYAFRREQAHNYDLSKYYMGIALLASNNVLWVITGERMDVHITRDDIFANLSAKIPNNAADGAMKAIPILTDTQSPVDSNTGKRTWTSSPNGYLISLHGASLSLTKATSAQRLDISVTITFSVSTVTMAFVIRNQSSSTVEVSNLYAFIMSGDAYSNDSSKTAPSYVDPGVWDFIDQNWPTAKATVPPSFPLTNPPDIYVKDWNSSYGLYRAARAYNAYTDFRANNNNPQGPSFIAAGASVSWTKQVTGITGDDFGDYADSGVFLALCVNVVPNVSYLSLFTSYD